MYHEILFYSAHIATLASSVSGNLMAELFPLKGKKCFFPGLASAQHDYSDLSGSLMSLCAHCTFKFYY